MTHLRSQAPTRRPALASATLAAAAIVGATTAAAQTGAGFALRALQPPVAATVQVAVDAPSAAALRQARVLLNGVDVTASLSPDGARSLSGTLRGLRAGPNLIVLYPSAGAAKARLTVQVPVLPSGLGEARGAALAVDCLSLAHTTLPQTTLSATLVPAGTLVGGQAMPAHCLLNGQMNPRVGEDGKNYHTGFQLRLPLDWNGRFLFQGGGGNDGAVQAAVGGVTGHPAALARGFAVASTDGGHQGGGASFRLDTQARIDHAYAAYVRVTEAAKSLIVQAYARPADRAYFMGCSGGGRQAMVFPQRFPTHFDGIVATAPAMRAAREASVAAVWSVKAYLAAAPLNTAGQPILSRALSNADQALLAQAALQRCDALDGLADGIIAATPAACSVDPAQLQCPGAKTDGCLSAEQVQAVQADFSGPRNAAGEALYVPFPWDAGVAASGWRSWKLGSSQTATPNATHATLMGGNIGYQFTPPDPAFQYLSFDFDADYPRLQEQATLLNTTSVDVDAFALRGGKMLLAHGVSDPVFSAHDTMRYVDELRQRWGGQADAIGRLFLVPGMNHCSGGPATDRYDALDALVRWVEQGRAPDSLLASAGPASPWPGRTRPLCPYPRVATYKGQGDPEQAASFECRQP